MVAFFARGYTRPHVRERRVGGGPIDRRLAELLPQGRFEIVSDSRTFIPEDQSEKLAAAVREFLAGQQDALA